MEEMAVILALIVAEVVVDMEETVAMDSTNVEVEEVVMEMEHHLANLLDLEEEVHINILVVLEFALYNTIQNKSG